MRIRIRKPKADSRGAAPESPRGLLFTSPRKARVTRGKSEIVKALSATGWRAESSRRRRSGRRHAWHRWSLEPVSIALFPLHLRRRTIGGLKKDDIFCNLRIPNQFQTAKEEVSLLIVTGRGIFCIDVKDWRGEVSVQKQNWQLKLKQEGQNITNIRQVPDPIQAITTKADHLWNHVKRSGASVRRSLFLPRVLFLSANCQLDGELRQRRELVSHGSLDAFVCSLKEGYVAWMSDALTPSWLSGHLSYRQLRGVRETLRRTGTWDLVRLCGGEQLKGDYQGCQYIALDRQETEELEFSGDRALWMGSLWTLLGHSPQVTVKMYKRGGGGWLCRTLSGSATIPSSAQVVFRISGDGADARIPASCIHSISLSI
ncbi:uncharacterized protein LOC108939506 [Scleropages formosus]|uniref:uncharacterized protein LOC108939506 n=1 Tax=Scleropages formosus TaxID=113540 RepID=UPI000878E5C0|nr:uncharacterized protein LOC108939506 [Scleropages formosus]